MQLNACAPPEGPASLPRRPSPRPQCAQRSEPPSRSPGSRATPPPPPPQPGGPAGAVPARSAGPQLRRPAAPRILTPPPAPASRSPSCTPTCSRFPPRTRSPHHVSPSLHLHLYRAYRHTAPAPLTPHRIALPLVAAPVTLQPSGFPTRTCIPRPTHKSALLGMWSLGLFPAAGLPQASRLSPLKAGSRRGTAGEGERRAYRFRPASPRGAPRAHLLPTRYPAHACPRRAEGQLWGRS